MSRLQPRAHHLAQPRVRCLPPRGRLPHALVYGGPARRAHLGLVLGLAAEAVDEGGELAAHPRRLEQHVREAAQRAAEAPRAARARHPGGGAVRPLRARHHAPMQTGMQPRMQARDQGRGDVLELQQPRSRRAAPHHLARAREPPHRRRLRGARLLRGSRRGAGLRLDIPLSLLRVGLIVLAPLAEQAAHHGVRVRGEPLHREGRQVRPCTRGGEPAALQPQATTLRPQAATLRPRLQP